MKKTFGLMLVLLVLAALGGRHNPGVQAVSLDRRDRAASRERSQEAEMATVAASLINPESDLEYLGAFRLPDEESNGTSWSYGGHGMGYYPLGDPGGESDGFPGSLFGISHPYQNFVSEFSIPAPLIAPDKDVDELPVATTCQPFADVTAGRQTGGLTGTTLGDVQYYPQQGAQTSDKLYWVMYEYYLPDHDEVSFGWCELDFTDLQSQGAWRLDDFPFAATSKYLFDIPQGWAGMYTPGKYLAAGRNRLVNNGSWGPALYAYGPWNDGNPPPDGSALDAVEMLKYDSDYMLHDYSHSDDWSDGAWLTTGDKSAVILAGMKAVRTSASGAEYYGEPGVDGCGYKGYHAEPYYAAILFYDPGLLAEVVRGTIRRHEVQPYAVFNLEDYMFKQGCRRTILGGVGYDRERNLLYVMEKGVEGYYARKPIVHVFRVADRGQAPDLSAPTVPANLQASTVISNRVDLSWEAASDNVRLVGYVVYRDGEPIATTVETAYSDDKVNPSATYSYTLAAWDARSNRSASSLPLVVTTPAGADERQPIISGIRASDVAGTGVMLSWKTDELATTILEYGVQYSGGETTYEDAALTTTHRVLLTGLTPDATYTYHASSVDATGLVTHTNEYPSKSFRTNSTGGLRNSEPVLNGIGSKRVSEGERLEFVVSADDLNDDVLLYSTTSLPPGASFDPGAGQFSWTPGFELAGAHPITFTVSDGQASDSERVTIFVEDNPLLALQGAPANRAIRLSWQVNATLPPMSTWQIDYQSETGTLYTPITGIISPTRAYTLTGLTNGVWYTVTLNAMLGSASFLTDTVRVMPAGRFVYLPLALASMQGSGEILALDYQAPQKVDALAQAPACGSGSVTCYYVCDCASGADSDCLAGDDAAAGTSAAPWQSYEQARAAFGALAPGDAILFCSGGAWDVSGGDRWVNGACEAGNRCWVGDYAASWASGDEGRPIIRRTDGAHGFALEDGGDAEHEEGYVFENLDIRGTGVGSGFFLYNDIDDVEIRNVLIQGFDLGVHLAGSNACNASDPQCDGQNQRITLRDSTIIDSERQGWLGASSGTQLINNTFENNGSSAIFDHNVYISGSSGGQTSGIRVIGNRLYRSAMVDGECTGVSLVVHGQHDDLLIEGNEVWEDVGHAGQGCWGIAVDNGYGSAEGFTNVVIRGNTVRNVGNMAIGVGACADCLIENNVIVHEQDFGITAIAAPDRDLGSGDLPQDNIIVRNNSIYIGPDSGGTAISVREMGDNHQIVSNAIYYAGSSSSFNCLRANLNPVAFDAIDYNLCAFPNASAAEWADGSGSLGDWQTATGFDTHSLQTDPGFANASNGDLSAASASAPMVDSGHPTLSSSIDIDGNARDARPDAGAYEFIPALSLYGRPADQAIHLSWSVNTTLPATSTWQIDYTSQTGTLYTPITGLISPTRVYTLSGLANYVWYTITLNAMLDGAPFLSDTVRVMPTDQFIYLPLVLRAP